MAFAFSIAGVQVALHYTMDTFFFSFGGEDVFWVGGGFFGWFLLVGLLLLFGWFGLGFFWKTASTQLPHLSLCCSLLIKVMLEVVPVEYRPVDCRPFLHLVLNPVVFTVLNSLE